jgi:hypothetical protein
VEDRQAREEQTTTALNLTFEWGIVCVGCCEFVVFRVYDCSITSRYNRSQNCAYFTVYLNVYYLYFVLVVCRTICITYIFIVILDNCEGLVVDSA